MILQIWRKEMPEDISDEELSNVSENFNALEELLSNSSRSASVTYSQPSHVSTPTAHV